MIAAFTLCVTSPAHADKHKRGKHDSGTPWADGVSKGNQKKAFELYDAGNALFGEKKYTDAIEDYEMAIQLWDHPLIEFNLTVCLINISKPLEAWDHLQAAMQYGDAPLGKQTYELALTDKALLEATLAELEVDSDQDGVQVMLDGRELFTGKANKTQHVLAGNHQLVATREGYETDSQALDLPAGKVTKKSIELQPKKVKVTVERENYERRWQWWIPWATVGTGVGFALIGTGVYLAARSDMKAYDNAFASFAQKNCPTGCMPSMIPSSLSEQETHARHVSGVGIGFWAAGGAIAAAAGVMAILNRPQLEIEGHPADVAIVATPGYVGANFTLTLK